MKSITMKRVAPNLKRLALAAAVTVCSSLPAQALEIAPGDYEVIPAGINLGVVYYQRAERSDLNVDGNTVDSDFDFNSDVLLFRYIRPIAVNDTLTADFNAVLPAVKLSTGGNAAEALGEASGVGDLTLGFAFKFLLDPETRDAGSLAFYANLPTGSYDNNDVLNIGENRYSLILQGAYVKHFTPKWGVDAAADVQLFTENDEFTPDNLELNQDPRVELQAILRYNPAPTTIFGAGLGHVLGGETEIEGVAQDNRLETTYARLTASHFIDQANQFTIQLGRDISAENGPEEKARINLRYARVF